MPELRFNIDDEPEDRYMLEVDPRAIGASELLRNAQVLTPMAPIETGLISELSGFASAKELTSGELNCTGKRNKVTLSAVARAILEGVGASGIKDLHTSTKAIFMDVATPPKFATSVVQGESPGYSTPASNNVEYATRGGYSESRGAVAFMNGLTAEDDAQLTAAATQMAKWFYEEELAPRLYGTESYLVLPPVAGRHKDEVPGHDSTCAVDPLMLRKHSPSVVSMVYHALRSEEILTSAGFEVHDDSVWNPGVNLRETDFNINDFWEAYRILRFSAGGGQANKQFDADFLVASCATLSLHGLCDEGGIWRIIFQAINVQPNRVLAVSPYSATSPGHKTHSTGQVVAAVANLQAIVSRALAETEQPLSNFVLPAGAGNEKVRQVVAMMEDEICVHLSEATGLTRHYWQQKISNFPLDPELEDRHLKHNAVNVVASYSPYISTYSVDSVGNSNGRYSYDRSKTAPLVFEGEYRTRKIVEGHRLLVVKDPTHRRKLQDGDVLFDGRMTGEAYYDGMRVETRATTRPDFLGNTMMDDGREVTTDFGLNSINWRDNGDLFPCAGDGTFSEPGKFLVSPEDVPDIALDANYKVSVTRYAFLGRMPGEGVNKKTRRMCREDQLFMKVTRVGSERPDVVDVEKYLRLVKKETRNRAKAETKRYAERKLEIARASQIRVENLMEDFSLSGKPDKTENVEKLVDGVMNFVEPIESAVVLMRDVFTGSEDIGSSNAVATLLRAKKTLMPKSTFTFVGPKELVVNQPDGTTSMVRELKFGAIRSARPWRPGTYAAEVGLLVSKMENVATSIATGVGRTLIDYVGEDCAVSFEESLRNRLGTASGSIIDIDSCMPFFYTAEFGKKLSEAMSNIEASKDVTPNIEVAEDSEDVQSVTEKL